jgi:hypothetical protein
MNKEDIKAKIQELYPDNSIWIYKIASFEPLIVAAYPARSPHPRNEIVPFHICEPLAIFLNYTRGSTFVTSEFVDNKCRRCGTYWGTAALLQNLKAITLGVCDEG